MPLYETLADAYDWLVPDALVAPAGSASAVAPALAGVPAGGRVLDCAAGTGQLAVGLALRGFAVTATDAGPAMIQAPRVLAREHGAALEAEVCAWEALGGRPWAGASTPSCAWGTRSRTPRAAPAGAPRCATWPASCGPAGCCS